MPLWPAPAYEPRCDRVATGDTAALETLYDRYASAVMGVALRIIGERMLAEEVVPETFRRIWQNAATFQAQRGAGRYGS